MACLFAVAIANQGKRELELGTNVEVSPDQDVDNWHYRNYYGHYYNPHGYYGGHGYWRRGRRSVEEMNQIAEASVNVKADTDAMDQDASQWYGLSYYGRYNPYNGHEHLPGRLATKDQRPEESYHPGWGYNRGSYGGYPYRPAYYYGHYPTSFSYAYSH